MFPDAQEEALGRALWESVYFPKACSERFPKIFPGGLPENFPGVLCGSFPETFPEGDPEEPRLEGLWGSLPEGFWEINPESSLRAEVSRKASR